MKKRTIALFVLLLAVVISSALYFHHQQAQHLMTVDRGAIAYDDYQRFVKLGIHCEETYETQGYEGPETIFRMFMLNQHQFHNLNPGAGFDWKQGTVLCVKGVWGISSGAAAFNWFWPVMAALCAAVGAAASWVVGRIATKVKQHASAPLLDQVPAATAV
mmetsp:Transcript_26806/g.58447  ORF Transcript_26806/g.58447 Transcript_26806/m.58447 type:complete len:160 (-) Transcript_26806:593-1072(-)|eukprot:CAMPEP_0202891326 /NCGR_PEP_ID=MMETSP1392-20130828/1410_1 /ASSEMBLY_ACC=CAM_ASM_000868 /TAXON_ID=225041 /ORGANISM="Chlamydomonas chlamydogama, Strain SAG 11-48b" /LENGTH=159 /DNA_ID=CAMNT_0049575039 /DNA_START=329 /DNA_END=808 /DNA_ORIENTATION=-